MRFAYLMAMNLLLLASTAMGATITVRKDGTGDYMVIQQALDVAADGDTILIGPGEYTESTMVRLPGWAYDIESFVNLQSDNVTLVGSGAESTIIGPLSYQGSAATFSPKGITYDVGQGALYISNLSVRNCYTGVWLGGTLYMDQCSILDNRLGLNWGGVGTGGWVRDSKFEVTASIFDPTTVDIGFGATGTDILMERCQLSHPATVRGVQGMVIRDCDLTGLALYSAARVTMISCRSVGTNAGIAQTLGGGGICEVLNSELDGTYAALTISDTAPGGRFVVTNSRLTGGAHGVLYSGNGAGACEIHNCDFVKGSGPMVDCAVSTTAVTHDLRNNYWGATSEAEIQSWINDHTDNPSIGATVLYSPFAGQSVPTESTSWGDLKALFR